MSLMPQSGLPPAKKAHRGEGGYQTPSPPWPTLTGRWSGTNLSLAVTPLCPALVLGLVAHLLQELAKQLQEMGERLGAGGGVKGRVGGDWPDSVKVSTVSWADPCLTQATHNTRTTTRHWPPMGNGAHSLCSPGDEPFTAANDFPNCVSASCALWVLGQSWPKAGQFWGQTQPQ